MINFENNDRRPEKIRFTTSLVGQSIEVQKGNRVLQRAALYFGGIKGTNMPEKGSFAKSRFLTAIEKIAREEDFWIEDLASLVGEKFPGGQESEVFATNDRKDVIKLNRFSFIGNNLLGVVTFIERINTHNALFPTDSYEIVGFSRDSQNNTCIVLKQPYAEGDEATQKDIDEFFEEVGAEKKRSGVYILGDYEINDALPNNVIKGKMGGLHFIDTFSINKLRIKEIQDIWQM